MRHAKIETTMKYYVGENAEKTAEMLWSQFGLERVTDHSDPTAVREDSGTI